MGFTITTIDGTTTEVAVGSSIWTITENYAPAAKYAALTPGEGIGLEEISVLSLTKVQVSVSLKQE